MLVVLVNYCLSLSQKSQYVTVLTMGRKAEERERRRERNHKRAQAVACALGIALILDAIIFLIAILCSAWDVGAYAFIAVFFIVPPLTWFTYSCLNDTPLSHEEEEYPGF